MTLPRIHDHQALVSLRPQVQSVPTRRPHRRALHHAHRRQLPPPRRARHRRRRLRHAHRRPRHRKERRPAPARREASRTPRCRRRHRRAPPEPHHGLLPRAWRPLRRPPRLPQSLGRLQGPPSALGRPRHLHPVQTRPHRRRGPGDTHHRLQRAAHPRQQGPRLQAAPLRRLRR